MQYTRLFGVTFFPIYVLGQHGLSDVLGGYAPSVLLLIPYCRAYARWRLQTTPAA